MYVEIDWMYSDANPDALGVVDVSDGISLESDAAHSEVVDVHPASIGPAALQIDMAWLLLAKRYPTRKRGQPVL
jgi:hypothetical protein